MPLISNYPKFDFCKISNSPLFSQLSPLQKRVATIAITCILCVAAAFVYFSIRYIKNFSFKQQNNTEKKEEIKTPEIKEEPQSSEQEIQKKIEETLKTEQETQKIEPAKEKNPNDNEIETINNQDDPIEVKAQPKKIIPASETIEIRLKKNRRWAVHQQQMEEYKRFELNQDLIPDSLQLRGIQKPIFRKEKKIDGILPATDVGIASCEGLRDSMEDADLATNLSFSVNHDTYHAKLFGIFDGHAGKDASAFVKNNLKNYLIEELERQNSVSLSEDGIVKALKEVCQKLDHDYQGKDGTTATIAFVLMDKVWVANVGDSRTILVDQEGTTIQASQDAKPSIDRFYNTIVKLGGYVLQNRVNGYLAVARAIGDKGVIGANGLCCVSPKPKISDYPLESFNGGYLILACDGLYDVASSDQIGEAIKKMSDQGFSCSKMASNLVYSAIKSGSSDNVSVMVVKL